jgi:hypothetical protein
MMTMRLLFIFACIIPLVLGVKKRRISSIDEAPRNENPSPKDQLNAFAGRFMALDGLRAQPGMFSYETTYEAVDTMSVYTTTITLHFLGGLQYTSVGETRSDSEYAACQLALDMNSELVQAHDHIVAPWINRTTGSQE